MSSSLADEGLKTRGISFVDIGGGGGGIEFCFVFLLIQNRWNQEQTVEKFFAYCKGETGLEHLFSKQV